MNLGVIVLAIIVIIGYINLAVRHFKGKSIWTDENS